MVYYCCTQIYVYGNFFVSKDLKFKLANKNEAVMFLNKILKPSRKLKEEDIEQYNRRNSKKYA